MFEGVVDGSLILSYLSTKDYLQNCHPILRKIMEKNALVLLLRYLLVWTLSTSLVTLDDLFADIILEIFQMGGRSHVQNEVLCRFIFPERPGALMKFLDVFSPRWNISLFHYRAQV